MKIIPTKKAIPLFSYIRDSQKKINDDERSFYSWHANYFTVNRKKILVLDNDLTLSPVVLADINAKNKKNLEEHIKLGIEEIFSYSDVSSSQISCYLLKAGQIELACNYNRSMIGVVNNMIQLIKLNPEDIDFNSIIQPKIMQWLSEIPFKSQTPEYIVSQDATKEHLSKLV
ncbi:DUF6933 domain-containing protein [Enterococcus sp. LJL90]